jgi:DNA-binding PadR family transcriptional regulator
MKHDIPLSLDYQTSPSIYSNDLEYTLGVLVAFSLLDVQIISRREYIDRIYKVTEKGLRMLENSLKDENTERMSNQLKLYIREMEDLPINELVAQAKKFINQAIRRL